MFGERRLRSVSKLQCSVSEGSVWIANTIPYIFFNAFMVLLEYYFCSYIIKIRFDGFRKQELGWRISALPIPAFHGSTTVSYIIQWNAGMCNRACIKNFNLGGDPL